jgi:hypothetical protein
VALHDRDEIGRLLPLGEHHLGYAAAHLPAEIDPCKLPHLLDPQTRDQVECVVSGEPAGGMGGKHLLQAFLRGHGQILQYYVGG